MAKGPSLLLERVARSWGFPEGDRFLAQMTPLTSADAVFGRHLLARGLTPGPEFTRILARCREVQDATGERDPEKILRLALERSA